MVYGWPAVGRARITSWARRDELETARWRFADIQFNTAKHMKGEKDGGGRRASLAQVSRQVSRLVCLHPRSTSYLTLLLSLDGVLGRLQSPADSLEEDRASLRRPPVVELEKPTLLDSLRRRTMSKSGLSIVGWLNQA